MTHMLASPGPLLGRLASPPRSFLSSWLDADRDTAWISVAGPLTRADVPELSRALGDSQSRTRLTVLDLRELIHLTPEGAQAIVTAGVHGHRLGRRLVLLRGRPEVDDMLSLISGVDTLEIHDLHAGEPAVLVLLQLAGQELA